MPLPKSVKVTGILYHFKEHEDLTRGKIWPKGGDPEVRLWGACDTGQQLIHFDTEQSLDTKKQTILHEVLHALLDHTTYANNNEQENICEALTSTLYQFIRDNPKFIEYIQEKK